MNKLPKELKTEIISNIKNSFIYSTISVQKENNSEHDWVELLKGAEWKETDYEGNTRSVNTKKSRFIKNLKLLSRSVSVKQDPFLLGIYGVVISDRSNRVKKVLNQSVYNDTSKDPSEFDYVINEKNLEQVLLDGSKKSRGLVTFSVSTFSGDNIPDCPECKGSGQIFCSECKGKGKIRCKKCEGRGWVLCEKCEGIGEIQYKAGNYANGDPRIKTKACPICGGQGKLKCNDCNGEGEMTCKKCNGEGKVTCMKCHGNGKPVSGSVMQIVKSFEDKYYFQKGVSLVMKSSRENKVIKPFFLKKIFSHKWLQISQMYKAPGKIITDNKAQIANEVFLSGDEYHSLYKAVQNDIKSLSKKQNTVCVLENYFILSPITVISMQYTDLDGTNSEIVFYVWENFLWCDCYEELSFGKLLLLKIKKALS